MGFEQSSDYESLFSSDELATIELVDWNEAGDQDLLLVLLTNLLSDVRDRLATDGDINTADLIDDLVLRLERAEDPPTVGVPLGR